LPATAIPSQSLLAGCQAFLNHFPQAIMVDMARSGGLYILLISIHGLIRGHDLELGRDADTGGQTKYVVELAKALARQEGVERVDLVTRLVVDDHVSPDYAVPIEKLAENLQIVRVKAGPNEYLPKEQLWPHMDSFADHLSTWLAEQPRLPDVVHTTMPMLAM
jgi:sucrose-phosphate synthase